MSLRGSYLSREEGSNGGAIPPLGDAPSPIKEEVETSSDRGEGERCPHHPLH